MIPVPPTTFRVTDPAEPPPVNPSPAVTPVIVPPPPLAAANEADTLGNPCIDKSPLALISPEAVTAPTNFTLLAVRLPITALSSPSNPIRSRVAPPDNTWVIWVLLVVNLISPEENTLPIVNSSNSTLAFVATS